MELPLKKAVFNLEDIESGIQLISLVSTPAIGYEAMLFNENKEIKLEIVNEDERIIFTPVLIPNQKIYRNMDGEEFNLFFDEQTISDLVLQFAKNGLANKADTNHSRQLIEGVTFFESFQLSDRVIGVNEKFNSFPKGTWFVSGKVNNDEVWQKMKSGEITGVSIDGMFKAIDIKASNDLLKKIEQLLF